MGCRLSRTNSIDHIEEEKDEAQASAFSSEDRVVSNSVQQNSSSQQNAQQGSAAQDNRNGNHSLGGNALSSKPIGEVESASQADFFRMLDEKIAHGRGLDSEDDEN